MFEYMTKADLSYLWLIEVLSLKTAGSHIVMKVGNGLVLHGLYWNDMTAPPHIYLGPLKSTHLWDGGMSV